MFAYRTLIGARRPESRRALHARMAIGLVRPVLLLFGVAASIVNSLVDPGSVAGGDWLRLAIFFGVQVLLWMLLHTRLAVDVVFTIAVALDATLLAATLVLDRSPASGATTFVVLMVIVGYFVRPAFAIAFGVAIGAVVALIGPRLEGWNDTGVIPTVSVSIVITALSMAYISSRMRADESQLEQLVASQDAAIERLRVVDQLRDQLIANVSHELRTPLTATIGAIETLLRPEVRIDDAQRDRLLQVARDGGLRLLALVEDLLTLGVTRPDSLDLTTAPARLSSVARDAITGLQDTAERPLHLTVRADPLVRIDRMRMLQVVSNLVVNALRHGEGATTVVVDGDDRFARLRVLDDGPGVDPAHAEELFLPFAKFSSRPDSSGLGLAICRTIVEAHEGTISYERTEDDRTCFTVELPLA